MTRMIPTLLRSCFFIFLASLLGVNGAQAQGDAKEKERLTNPINIPALDWLKTPPVPCTDAEAADEKGMKPYVETIPGTEVTFKMLPIPGGKFKFGSPETEEGRHEDEGPQVEVEVKPFWMEEHEVTWGEFSLFAQKELRKSRAASGEGKEDRDKIADKKMEMFRGDLPTDPARFLYAGASRDAIADALGAPTPPYDISSISYGRSDKPNCPASGMTYVCAQAYCKWLTIKTGRYYRLPTEAEWEYACRAGTTTPFSFGDDPEKLGDYACFFDNAEGGYDKVMKRKPNPWGFYDMHGNVGEWVCEQYDKDAYKKRADGSLKTAVVPTKGDFGQVFRGGYCDNEDPADLRAARRMYTDDKVKRQDPMFPQSIWWNTEGPFIGFRIVRPLNPPTVEEAALFEPDPKVWKAYTEQNTRE